MKFISLNIERDWHYARVFPFIERERPLVACLLEVLDSDVARFESALGAKAVYTSVAVADKGRGTEVLGKKGIQTGHGIFSALPIVESGVLNYCGCPDGAPILPESGHGHKTLVWAKVRDGSVPYTITLTHFTWTLHGEVTDEQRTHLAALLKLLERFPDTVLAGDFNAPRGREIWDTLAMKYRDNIPKEHTTSLDQNLHATPGLQYVVDGLFSTPEYVCEDTTLVCDVSDHCAVVSSVRRFH